ncbi:hypothetical protein [Dactylosporangium cerinum]
MSTAHTTTAGVDEHLFADFADVAARQFDYVIVGAGCTGTIVAHQVLREQPQARVLLLEQGPYLLPDHVQNLGLAYQPLMDQAVAAPWRSDGDLDVVAQVPYLGGRTLFWSGSCPQPARHQLRGWPAAVVDDLEREWPAARELLGVRPAETLNPAFGELHRQLRKRIHAGAGDIAHVLPTVEEDELDAQLAAGVPGPPGRGSSAPCRCCCGRCAGTRRPRPWSPAATCGGCASRGAARSRWRPASARCRPGRRG